MSRRTRLDREGIAALPQRHRARLATPSPLRGSAAVVLHLLQLHQRLRQPLLRLLQVRLRLRQPRRQPVALLADLLHRRIASRAAALVRLANPLRDLRL